MTDGGGEARAGQSRSRHRRRARNRRYRRNRARRSLLTILVWNAEGLRQKIAELSSWLPGTNVDDIAVQQGQFPEALSQIPGFQPPVVTRRTRGRRDDGHAKGGGDVVIYVRDGRHFEALSGPFKPAAVGSTEVCGVRLLGAPDLDLINIYRPPIRSVEADERVDHFDPDALPDRDNTIVTGDINAHHPLWDSNCEEADEVGDRVAAWLDGRGWSVLNDGRPTFTSYRSGGQTAPDVAFCSPTLLQRCSWRIGTDLGSDHLSMLLEVRSASRPPGCIRKPRWSFKKAAWLAFHDECEAAFEEAGPEHESVQELATRFHGVLQRASLRHIPRERGLMPGRGPWIRNWRRRSKRDARQGVTCAVGTGQPRSVGWRRSSVRRRWSDESRSATSGNSSPPSSTGTRTSAVSTRR